MKYRKIKRMAVIGLLLAFICCLSGCGFSFCGFPVGSREELVFACSEGLPKENTGQAECGFGGADDPAGTSESSGSGEAGSPASTSESSGSGGTGSPAGTSESSGSGGTDSSAEVGESGITVDRTAQAAPGLTADGRVNINTAGLEELMTLNGVGETRAKAIIEYRETYGPFQSKEDIMLIPGIKEGIFSKIEEQIAVQ